jgi:outer membrane protein
MILVFSFLFLSFCEDLKIYNLNLSNAIQRLLSDNYEIKAHRYKIFHAESRIKQARSHRYPSMDAYFNVAPIPKVSGDYTNSEKDWNTWGSFIKFGGKITQPISTFGLIDAYLDLANSNLELELAKYDLKKNELIFLIKKYYYSYQLANDLVNLVEDGKKKFDEAIKTSEELIKKRKIKRQDIYQLQIAYSVFMTKYLEAHRSRDLAYEAIKLVLSIPPNATIKLEENTIVPEEIDLKEEKDYLQIALNNRHELRILNKGLDVFSNLIKVEERKRFPVFYASLFGSIARANVIEEQNSQFLYNPYNTKGGAIVFGLKFNLDWWKNDPLIAQARAQYDFFNFDSSYKKNALSLELKKVYREAIDSKKSLDYALSGERNANRWNFNATLAYALGNIGAKEMLDAIKAVLESKFVFNMAIYDYNIAIANLSRICSQELVKDINY